jgi:hypothetical protein
LTTLRSSSPITSSDLPHAYPLLVRDHGLATCWLLLMRSLPYAMARLGVSLGAMFLCLIWLTVAVGGAYELGIHVTPLFGMAWLLPWLVAGGWIWGTVLRYGLHLIACGHVAVLTRLITEGTAADPGESQFSYGRRVVVSRFVEVTALFGFSALIRGVLGAFHATMGSLSEMLPIPGLGAIANVIDMIAKAATRYLDKVILSYTLVRTDCGAWQAAQDGMIYYCQNAGSILKTSVWMVVLEYTINLLLFFLLFVVAGMAVVALPEAVRDAGAVVTLSAALLLTMAIRAAFVKPLFLISMLVRFHSLIESQPVNREWSGYLDQLSPDFSRGWRSGTMTKT